MIYFDVFIKYLPLYWGGFFKKENMSDFEKRVQRAQQEKAAKEHREKMDEKRRAEEVEKNEKLRVADEARKERIIRSTSEWRAMKALSKNPEFLEALEMYWEKNVEKKTRETSKEVIQPHSLLQTLLTGKTKTIKKITQKEKVPFDEFLLIEESPVKNSTYEYGYIKLSFFDSGYTTHFGEGQYISTFNDFTLYAKDGLIFIIHEWSSPGSKERSTLFEGEFKDFLDYMVKQLV
jgi:hypothetical protein